MVRCVRCQCSGFSLFPDTRHPASDTFSLMLRIRPVSLFFKAGLLSSLIPLLRGLLSSLIPLLRRGRVCFGGKQTQSQMGIFKELNRLGGFSRTAHNPPPPLKKRRSLPGRNISFSDTLYFYIHTVIPCFRSGFNPCH